MASAVPGTMGRTAGVENPVVVTDNKSGTDFNSDEKESDDKSDGDDDDNDDVQPMCGVGDVADGVIEEDIEDHAMFQPDGSDDPETGVKHDDTEALQHMMGSPVRGWGHCQKFQRVQYHPQSAEFTGENVQAAESRPNLLRVINLLYRGNSYHLINGKVSTNPGKRQE